ncbi:MAG: lytic transglycosylase [Actinomycetota bacterium]
MQLARPRGSRAALAALLALAAAATAALPGWSAYTVRRGDNLWTLAARYQTSVADLVAANNLPRDGDLILAGQTLQVPRAAPPVASPAAPQRRVVERSYTVAPGDNLITIAQRFGADVDAVASRNRLADRSYLRIGQTLVVPVVETVAPAVSVVSPDRYPPAVRAAADRNRAVLAGRRLPSREEVRVLVVRTARAFRVDPNLALAVAWQESGFNQRMVSPANAVGVMQVLPRTGDWVGELLGRRLDLLDTGDNIVAGVALLRTLLAQAPPDQAVAGYYQGLASVRSKGMYAETQRYVQNVLALRDRFAGQR